MASQGFISGDPWFLCDICNLKYRTSESRMQWNGLRVCNQCWSPKHPQLSVRAVREKIAVKDARPRQTDVFRNVETSTTLDELAAKGTTVIMVDDDTGISAGYAIAVTLDNGSQIWTTVDRISPTP